MHLIVFKSNRGHHRQSFQSVLIIFIKVAIGFIENLKNPDNLSILPMKRNCQHFFCAIAGMGVDLIMEITVRLHIVTEVTFLTAEDLPGNPLICIDDDLLIANTCRDVTVQIFKVLLKLELRIKKDRAPICMSGLNTEI
ncbi:hypothetical protein D3C87_1556810 [compost metagenome]